ncbi:hypothetical protein KY285_035521 [Solanum tuberosum]|nr:hypothetical protein KY285_035521 [Solanum tuberosum]
MVRVRSQGHGRISGLVLRSGLGLSIEVKVVSRLGCVRFLISSGLGVRVRVGVGFGSLVRVRVGSGVGVRVSFCLRVGVFLKVGYSDRVSSQVSRARLDLGSGLGLGLESERKDQIGGEKEQPACRREVPRSSTMSSNDPKHDDAEG